MGGGSVQSGPVSGPHGGFNVGLTRLKRTRLRFAIKYHPFYYDFKMSVTKID